MNDRSLWQNIKFYIATGGPVGFTPKAPGTAGTLLAIPIYLLIAPLTVFVQILIVILIIMLAIWAATEAGKVFRSHDDPRIIIDEVAGYLVTMIGIAASWPAVILGFILFRIFDITKPYPVRLIDRRWRTGVGVVMDDVAAGIYALIALRIILKFFPI